MIQTSLCYGHGSLAAVTGSYGPWVQLRDNNTPLNICLLFVRQFGESFCQMTDFRTLLYAQCPTQHLRSVWSSHLCSSMTDWLIMHRRNGVTRVPLVLAELWGDDLLCLSGSSGYDHWVRSNHMQYPKCKSAFARSTFSVTSQSVEHKEIIACTMFCLQFTAMSNILIIWRVSVCLPEKVQNGEH